jgi:hypothetical protein
MEIWQRECQGEKGQHAQEANVNGTHVNALKLLGQIYPDDDGSLLYYHLDEPPRQWTNVKGRCHLGRERRAPPRASITCRPPRNRKPS